MKKLSFQSYLSALFNSEEPALVLILSQLSTQIRYGKNDVIYPRGRIPSELSYLETGSAIALSQSKPKRRVLRFWTAKQMICPVGFFDNSPATQSIVALDDCLVSRLTYHQLFRFLSDFPEAYKLINAMLKYEINLVEQNIKSMSHLSSFQNHEALLNALALSFDE
ncbi:MAG: Crp/Fnr family transcriptional regulator [Bacteroidia bacterium]